MSFKISLHFPFSDVSDLLNGKWVWHASSWSAASLSDETVCLCKLRPWHYLVGTPPSIELLDYPEYVKHSGHHFWYSSTQWAKITSKPHLFVTFWSRRNDNLKIMYNYKPCTLSINSTTAKRIYFEKYFPVSMTFLQNQQFWHHSILCFLFSCVQNWVLDTESSNEVRGFGVANSYSWRPYYLDNQQHKRPSNVH